MIKVVLRITLLSLMIQPLIANSEPFKCLFITEKSTDFIQHFDIGGYNKTFNLASQFETVRFKGQTLGVSRLVECIPSTKGFSSFSAREQDKNTPK